MTKRRRGSLLLEATIAAVLIAAVLIGVAQLLAVTAVQQRDFDRQQLATQTVANVMEDVAARPWDELASDEGGDFTAMELPAAVTERLPDARLEMAATDVGADEAEAALPARRIVIQLDWINSAGMRVEPVTLTAWRFAPLDAGEAEAGDES